MAVVFGRVVGVALLTFGLVGCSNQSKIESEIHKRQPKAELSGFKSISPEEYGDAMDEWSKPFAGSRWRPVGRETVAKPQFSGAKFYSVHAQVTNAYGNAVKTVRYCSILRGAVNCQVTKYLTSLAEAKRGAAN